MQKRSLTIAAVLIFWSFTTHGQPAAIKQSALDQIGALLAEKDTWTPVQTKMDSELIHAIKFQQGQAFAAGKASYPPDVTLQADGRVLVDLDAYVTSNLLALIEQGGGQVIGSFPQFKAVRALVTLDQMETLAASADVIFIRRAVPALTNTGSVDSQGDATHMACAARSGFGVAGTGVKVGVLSDSVDYLANSQALGDLGTVTVLPGQSGVPGSGEGTAMLEIVHDLAPNAQLYFATAFNGEASFAQNILNLYSNGCSIIVDDVGYFDESPFQDGIVAQAVNTVTAGGALYFSSAANSGNLDAGTSGTWEGDFVDGGSATSPIPEAGRLHSFGASTFDTLTSSGYAADLFWSDPWGASTNDYDLFLLDSTGSTVVGSSMNRQNGTQNPYEYIGGPGSGERLVIVKYSGAARFLHLDTQRGRLNIATSGATVGHSAATNAFSVAATPAAAAWGASPSGPFPNPFSATNQVEAFSSDGPRHVFYQADGTAITPGNYSSTGGAIRQKPDITAADGVVTTLPSNSGLNPFYGTSAAAPHAGAIAAALWSYNHALTTSQIRNLLTSTALDIGTAGVDRDSGYGIVMAYPVLTNLTGLAPLAINLQPPNQTVMVGGTATFSVTAVGTPPLSYSWRRNANPIAGATASTYSTNNVQLIDSGSQFSCLVSNVQGTLLSSNGTLTAVAPPANDQCAGAIVISSTPYSNSQSTTTASSTGDPVPSCVGGFGNGVWYAYTSPANGTLIVDTFGSSFDTGLGLYTGTCGSLVQIACNDDSGGTLQSSITNSTTAGTTYYILAGGYAGSTGNLVFHLAFTSSGPAPPFISSQPVNQTVAVGGTATFTIGATGSAPLSYFWKRNGAFIPGANSATYSTNNVQLSDTGSQFSCTVSNAIGITNSSSATLTVISAGPAGGVAYLRSTNGLPWGLNDNEMALTNVFGSAWQDLRYETVNPATLLSPANKFIVMEGGADGGVAMGTFLTNNLLTISNWVAAGGSLFVDAAPYFSTSFSIYLGFGITLNVGDASSSASAANPTHPIFNGPYLPVGTSFTGGYFGHATVSGSGLLAIITNASDGNYVLAEKSYASGHLLFGGMTLPSFHLPQPQGSNLLDNILVYAAAQSALTNNVAVFNFESGLQGFVLDNTYGSGNGLWHLSTGRGFNAGHSPSNSLYYGHNETVTGGGNYDNGTNNGGVAVSPAIPLPNASPLTLSFNYLMAVESTTSFDQAFVEVSTNNGSSYTVVASKNILGGLTNSTGGLWVNDSLDLSSYAGATVRLRFRFDTIDAYANSTEGWYLDDVTISAVMSGTAPSITLQPTNQTVAAGGTATFTVGATGSAPLYYFWQRNGSPITGATSATYTTNNVQLSDSGSQFSCVVSNAYGVATSQNALLTVVGIPPGITVQPVSQWVPAGGAAWFSVAASGSTPLTYRWFHSGTNITGAMASTWFLGSVTPDWGGTYFVVVTNSFGSVSSLPATLTVLVASATNDFILNGKYVSLPVATNGQLLSLRLAQGGRFNPAGTGGTNGIDFWYPGMPIYNYVVGLNGNNYVNGGFATLTVSNLSSPTLLHALVSGTVNGPVTFSRDISFGVNDKLVKVIDTIQNYGVTAVPNVVTLDNIDPDQGEDGTATATFVTYNDVVNVASTNDAVVAVGTNNNLSLLLGSESGMEIPSANGFNNLDAYACLTVVDPNGAPADIAINLAQNYGTLNAGQTKSASWYMLFGNSYNEVTNIYRISIMPKLELVPMNFNNCAFTFALNGPAGSNFVLQSSSNLRNWTTALNYAIPASGSLIMIDPNACGLQCRFYRAAFAGPLNNSASQSILTTNQIIFLPAPPKY